MTFWSKISSIARSFKAVNDKCTKDVMLPMSQLKNHRNQKRLRQALERLSKMLVVGVVGTYPNKLAGNIIVINMAELLVASI